MDSFVHGENEKECIFYVNAVFSDDFLHFLKIKKKFVEFTKTILWL